MKRISSRGDHFSGTQVTLGFKQPTREHRPGRPFSRFVEKLLPPTNLESSPYLVLLQVTLTMPPVLPQARWALTPPFHPYLAKNEFFAIGGIFSVALVSDHSAWALPSTLPFGVRTFLSQSFPVSSHPAHSHHQLLIVDCAKRESKRSGYTPKKLFRRLRFEMVSHIEDSMAIRTIQQFVTSLHFRDQLRRKLKLASSTGTTMKLGNGIPFSHRF
jgi:hypothetical protein